MKVSTKFIETIKSFEGCRLTAYWDKYGKVWTIGFGHTKGVAKGQKITESQAVRYLLQDIASFETFVNGLNVCKTQGQFDALVDFAYNCGCGNLTKSTLLKKIKAKSPVAEIQAEFRKWNKSGGVVLPGLVKRREWEAQQYAS